MEASFRQSQILALRIRFNSLPLRSAQRFVSPFEGDDLRSAGRTVEAAGPAVVGRLDHDSAREWIEVHGADGSLRERASRRG